MTDHIPMDSLVRRINNEPAVALLAGRALVLQLAHPAVAHGVEDHSDFRTNPFKRLRGTAEAMFAIVNGSEALAAGVGGRIHRIHEHVVGPGYEANRVENLMWVHATLVDSALLAYTTFVGALSAGDVEAFYQDSKLVSEPLGLPVEAHPPTVDDFRAYFDGMVNSMEVDGVARDLVNFVLRPRLPGHLEVPLRPILGLERLITYGTTPKRLRAEFGMVWDGRRQRVFDAWVLAIRTANRVQPAAIRSAPARLGGELLVRRARRRLAA
ncbi:MAG TPA: oxygenase MpaB family protein [Acidimicrobiales bacterium]